ncbi:MAG: LPXTG cell wall anchor domain-containing protein, partial [[Eubacterium] sulci]|nr:LPXTG cell wall anchor domain-containing protein [[Eubacterium] sulci]
YGTDYTSEEGSTIISFAPTFLKSLKPGSYVGRIKTNAGYAEFTLAVQSKHVAIAQSLSRGATSKARLGRINTGDSTNMLAFIIFPAAILAAIGLTLGRRKFHK